MYGIIYKVTNTVNQRLYIGQTIKSLNERKNCHYQAQDDTYFHRAIAKYSRDVFIWEVIDQTATDSKMLNELEIHYIETLQTHSTQHGYNMTWGGDTSWEIGRLHKIKTVSQFDINGNYIATYESLTAGAIASSIVLGRISYSAINGHPTFNTRWQFGDSQVYKHKLRARGTTVYQFNTDGICITSFDNALHAYENTGIHNDTIRNCCIGISNSAGGYFWSYNENAKFNKPVRQPSDTRPILKLDNDGNILQEFKNLSAISTNASYRQSIRLRLINGKPCSNGFFWQRK